MKSTVYYTKIKSRANDHRVETLCRILERSARLCRFEAGEIVPIKLTIGDSACVYNIGPQLIRPIALAVRSRSARPFLFDTNVIYTGARQNSVDHRVLAEKKGFTAEKAGAPFVVADGVLGSDGVEIKLKNGTYIKKIKVPSFVGVLDSLIVVSHVTGHLLSGYGGAIKNVAMGMVSRPTKQAQHSAVKPKVKENKCTGCGHCVDVCPVSVIAMADGKASIDRSACIGCGECLCACSFDAISVSFKEDPAIFCYRMAESAACILSKFRKTVFINFAIDITKDCDCISSDQSGAMLRDDAGILISNDIVGLEQATLDIVGDVFSKAWNTDSHVKMIEYAKNIGLGNPDYELIEV